MQQKSALNTEYLELAMKLESSHVGETSVGMMQIQSQLANLTLQIQDIKKRKEVQEELWCTRCRIKGHHKDNCLMLMNYVAKGVPNPINA